MIDWLAENPWPVLAMCGVVIVGLAGGYLKTGRKELLLGIAGVGALALGVLIFEWNYVTPREQVKAELYKVASAIEQDDQAAVLDHFLPSSVEHRALVEAAFKVFRVEQVKIKTNLRIDVEPERTPPLATAEFNVVGVGAERSGNSSSRKYPAFVIVKYVRHGDRWLIKSHELQPAQEGFKKRDR